MTVDDWVFEAVERAQTSGATVREIQRDIDERRCEELALDTIQSALDTLARAGRIEADGERWRPTRRTSKQDALRALFGDDAAAEDTPTGDR